jgi:hypothetical protein
LILLILNLKTTGNESNNKKSHCFFSD